MMEEIFMSSYNKIFKQKTSMHLIDILITFSLIIAVFIIAFTIAKKTGLLDLIQSWINSHSR
jgi:hypothetical protein